MSIGSVNSTFNTNFVEAKEAVFCVNLIESKQRLVGIWSEVRGWYHDSHRLKEGADNYRIITKSIRDTLAGKIGLINQSSNPADLDIVAAYDKSGNLQGVATFYMNEKEAKIHRIVTAIWNKEPEINPLLSCRGSGSAVVFMIMDKIHSKFKDLTALFVEPTRSAVEFYEKMGFKKIDRKPEESGSDCVMKIEITEQGIYDFHYEKISLKKRFFFPYKERFLPIPRLHYRLENEPEIVADYYGARKERN